MHTTDKSQVDFYNYHFEVVDFNQMGESWFKIRVICICLYWLKVHQRP